MFKNKTFIKIYLSAVSVFVLLIAVGAIILSSILSAFEKTRPSYLMEDMFDKYFATHEFEGALNMAHNKISDFENSEQIARGLKEKFKDKELTFYEASGNENTSVFAVVAIEKTEEYLPDESEGQSAVAKVPKTTITSTKIATLTFEKTEEIYKWGFKKYELMNFEINAKGQVTAKINAPDSSKVFVNGNELTADLVTKNEESDHNKFLPEDAAKLNYYVYTVPELFSDPVVTAEDKNGKAHVISRSEIDGSYTAELNYDNELEEKYSAYVIEGEKKIAEYMRADTSLASITPYFDTASAYYKEVKTSNNTFDRNHNGYDFADEYCGEFYRFDDKTICCHLSFNLILHRKGKDDYFDKVDKIVYLREIDGNYKICAHAVR